MLAQSREAFVALDEGGAVVGWNRAAQETFGWSREEAIGRPVAELLIPERFREAHRAGLARHVATGETRVIGKRLELWALRRDGREIPVELVISTGLPGQGAAFHAFLHDISERRRAEQELRLVASIVGDSEDAILSGTPEGIVETWNAGAERLYGYRADEMIGRSIAVLLPDGDLSAMADINELVQAGERVRDLKTRERRKDGSLVDVSVSIFPITDDDGRVVRIASIVRDVSERTRGERELREAHARFESAFEHAPIGMAIMSLEGAWLSVNRALCDLLGRTREELLATDFRSVTHPADLAADLELLQRTLRGEIDRYELEKRYLRPDGRIVWGFLARSLVRDADGQPVHFVTQVQDITARRSTEDHLRDHAARLEALAIEDPLTGLPNHRAFAAELSRRAREPGHGLSVVLLEVEEGGGEAVGDRLIREVASGLAGVAREDDLAARLEGRRFGLLVDGGAEAARAVVDRAREERIGALLAALDARDHYTGDHSKDVVELAVAVARRLELAPGVLREVEHVAVLHDIGKVGIPDAVLQKQGRLTEGEWELMRQHPAIGERIVRRHRDAGPTSRRRSAQSTSAGAAADTPTAWLKRPSRSPAASCSPATPTTR